MRGIIPTVAAIAIIILGGCSKPNGRLTEALERAGDNRTELETVLTHYADMPEKQAAARWLIANMPGHYGYEGSLLDSAETTLATIANLSTMTSLSDSVLEIWKHRNLHSLPRRPDLASITAKMLIENIDQAYAQWKKRKWNKRLSFEDFCEYILPYRIGDERLTNWRPVYDSIFAKRLDSLYNGDDVLEAVKIVSQLIDSLGPRAYNDQISSPYRDPLSLLTVRVGTCRDDCSRMVSAMRSCGIPVTIDHLMPSPEFGIGHTWISVLDIKSGLWLPYGYDQMPLTRDSIVTDGRVKGKVYRYMFERQRAPQSIPENVRIESNHSRVKDVTANYFGHNSVDVNCYGEGTPLLAAWTGGKFVIIGTGHRKGNKARFDDVEPGVILFPAIYKNDTISAAGYPFIVENDGTISVMRPDKKNNEKVSALRKIPLGWRKREWLDKRIMGMVIEVDADKRFLNSDTLVKISSPLDSSFRVFALANPIKAQYMRISPSVTGEIMLSELTLSESDDAKDTINFKIETPLAKHLSPKNLSDNNKLTYTEIPGSIKVIARIKMPSVIRRVELTARNDDNFIVEGREYELFWHDGSRGWQSAGRKVATERSVSFDVPKGAVCIVRCLTTGREEQPFIWRDGRQMFSLDLSKARYK